MIKHILIAVTTALLVLPNLSSTILADPPEVPDDAGRHRPQFSAQDFAALTDVRIAALKSGLQLKPTQEKKWFVLETVLRDEAKTHAARAAEWREKAEEPREHRSVIEGLQQGAKRLAARSAELEKLADAAKPLYDSLDDAQKGRFRPLLHIAGGRHWHHEHEGFRHS